MLLSELVINGGKKLSGTVKVNGAKNAVLPLLAATVLINGKTVLHNCPYLSDVDACLKILTELGCKCKYNNHTIEVDTANIKNCKIPENLMREMRSSIVFLGAVLPRCNSAVISMPGGCEIGPRPIDLHLKSLRKMGVEIEEEFGILNCNCPNGIKGTTITLLIPSVGATENIILAGVLAKGNTVIRNAAREPEIENLCDFLVKCGAKISGQGTSTIKIKGVDRLTQCEFSVMPDRIEASTFIACCAVTGGNILLKNIEYEHIKTVVNCFENMGCKFKVNNNCLTVYGPEKLNNFDSISTMAYPGFPTDSGSIIISCASVANGTSVLVENIFENRFKFVDELNRLGANIKIVGKAAIITGADYLTGAGVHATDLRGGAALIVAGLCAKGTTVIKNIYHIDRGYESIENSLNNLGADIIRRQEV